MRVLRKGYTIHIRKGDDTLAELEVINVGQENEADLEVRVRGVPAERVCIPCEDSSDGSLYLLQDIRVTCSGKPRNGRVTLEITVPDHYGYDIKFISPTTWIDQVLDKQGSLEVIIEPAKDFDKSRDTLLKIREGNITFSAICRNSMLYSLLMKTDDGGNHKEVWSFLKGTSDPSARDKFFDLLVRAKEDLRYALLEEPKYKQIMPSYFF